MIDIQPYDNEALEALADLWLASWRSTGISVAGQTTRQELRDRIPRELAADWTVYLAYEEGALVGFVALRMGAARLDQFFVAPDRQGQGVGKMLLDFVKVRLPDGFWLSALAANQGACRFYEREGLVLVGPGKYRTLGLPTVIYRWGEVEGLERQAGT